MLSLQIRADSLIPLQRMKSQPRLNFWQIWNMSFGFLGIQMGFALQNANVSRILQTLGADVHHLSWFWLAAPVTGLLVQPIIGHYSDRTWNRMGRRKPYFLAGAILASLALIFMPNSPAFAAFIAPLWMAAGMLMIMDASMNISMEPFRALVADMLPSEQRTLGFSIQSFFIGTGAVIGSVLPWVLTNLLGVSNEADPGKIPASVQISFYAGAAIFISAILWTIFRTKEYPPEEYNEYHPVDKVAENKAPGLLQIFENLAHIPKTMWQLAVVQYFSWFALFAMWVFTTPAITEHVYGTTDTSSVLYNKGANWVGILFGVYNGVAALYAWMLPKLAKLTSRKTTHMVSLIAGGIGLLSIYLIKDPNMLIFSMIGVGIAWSSILAMPYAMLAGSLPAGKMGVYMGIFNFFIVIPQIINGLIGGPIISNWFGGHAIYALVIAGISMLIAAVTVLFVQDEDDK